jgi:DNA-binding MarR family transcriptional regulator
MSTNDEYAREMSFIKLVAARYAVLRPLYLDREHSFMKLSEISGVDEANLSRYIGKLDEEGLIKTRKVESEGKRDHTGISLSTDVKRVIQCIVSLRGFKTALPLIPNLKHIDGNLSLLKKASVQALTADHIQATSRNYIVPANSRFFSFLGNKDVMDSIRPVAAILLRSLKNMIRNSTYDSRKTIEKKVMPFIEFVKKEMREERAGIVAQEILNEFYLDKASYEDLTKEYFDGILNGSKLVSRLRKRLVDRFPERKIDLRSRLLKNYSESDNETRLRIESEFVALI